MILKNIFGKTLEAAKKTAYQMYGEDILILEASEATPDGKKAKVTIFSDQTEHAPKPAATPKQAFASTMQQTEEGVAFERSTPYASQTEKKESAGLMSLRKFATEQILTEKKKEQKQEAGTTGFGGDQFLPPAEEEQEKTSNTYYSRSNMRRPRPLSDNMEAEPKDMGPKTVLPKPGGKFITHFKESKPKEVEKPHASASTAKADKRAIKALHKRFDKLEAILDSALISANLDYASHPAFQQLVHTGISTSTIARWFSDIIQTGTDPYDQPQLFMTKLGGIIRQSLGKPVIKEPEQFMLFAGAAGSGKTSLIMKLCQHPDAMLNKKVAVVSIHPQSSDEPYYTILEPFCRDNNIPFYSVQKGLDVNEHLEEWKEFDHVLIDTPSLSTTDEDSFRDYWKIRQVLTPVTPLEVHYVVNASRNRFYFNNATAKQHPMQPDYLSITHLDEVTQWGPIIPFIKEMACSARYLSIGTALPTSLQEFDPKWFAQQVLETN